MPTDPDDPTLAVLANLAELGVDTSQPLWIEFPVAVPDEASATRCLEAMTKAGYATRAEFDPGEPDFDPDVDDALEFGPAWTVYADVWMIPEQLDLVRVQEDLDRIVGPLGGNSDGWGVTLSRDGDAPPRA